MQSQFTRVGQRLQIFVECLAAILGPDDPLYFVDGTAMVAALDDFLIRRRDDALRNPYNFERMMKEVEDRFADREAIDETYSTCVAGSIAGMISRVETYRLLRSTYMIDLGSAAMVEVVFSELVRAAITRTRQDATFRNAVLMHNVDPTAPGMGALSLIA